MKVKSAFLGFGLSLLACAAPALAADFGVPNSNGIVDLRGSQGIPVPAPAPVPNYKPNWYYRFDLGVGIVTEPDVKETGFAFGADSEFGFGQNVLTSDPAWLRSEFPTFFSGGAGVGYYFGNGWRADVTGEKLSQGYAEVSGSTEYETYSYQPDPNNPAPPAPQLPAVWQLNDQFNNAADPNVAANANGTFSDGIGDTRTRVTINDRTNIDRSAWMFNVYRDFDNHSRFTPYIGGGVGFTWDVLKRTNNSKIETCNAVATTFGVPDDCALGVYNQTSAFQSSRKLDQLALAASAQVGISIDIYENTKLDLGYRYLYLAGSDIALDVSLSGSSAASTVSYGAQHLNEFHAALRYDIY